MKIISPASATNIGSGWDVFGLSFKEPFDEMEVVVTDSGRVEIEVTGYPVPIEPKKNTAGYAALRMLEKFGIKDGLLIKMHKGIKPASGIGSSGASAAGVAYCINKLFELNLPAIDVIKCASFGEIISIGEPLPDNIAPDILGGFTLIRSYENLDIIKIDPPEDMGIVIATPNIEKGSSKLSREAVPREAPMINVRENVGHASLFVAGMALKNLDYIKKGMHDVIVEPARVRYGIIREFPKLKKLGEELNAGIAASGSGPSIMGIIEKERRNELAKGMKEIYENAGYKCETITTEPGDGIREI